MTLKSHNLGGNDWQNVFEQRNVWQLTPSKIQNWQKENKSFFHFVKKYVSPESKILELGCGPGRHAISLAQLGYTVHAIDRDRDILCQARNNAVNNGVASLCQFELGDIHKLEEYAQEGFECITHGGIMEHFESPEEIRNSLTHQLLIAPKIVFDVPIKSKKNISLFKKDAIFRNIWSPEYWLKDILGPFHVTESKTEYRENDTMTDDFVCIIEKM